MSKAQIRIFSINLVLVGAVGGAGFWGYSVLHPAPVAAVIQTVTVVRGDVTATVSATGKVISPSDLGFAPLVAGTLSKLFVKVGDHVSVGQTLAQIDTTNLTTALASANASVVNANSVVAALIPTKSAAELAQSALQLSQARAAVELAKKNQIDNTTITQSNSATYQSTVDSAKKSLDDAITNTGLSANTYQSTVDSAKKTLDDATANVALSAKTYQSNVDAAVLNYNNYLGLYGPAGITVAFCASINTINANCTQLVANYLTWQNALATQISSLLKDKQSIDNLKLTYNNALASQISSLLKDKQSIDSFTIAYNNALVSQKNNLAKDALTIAGYASSVQSAQNAVDNLIASTNVSMQPAKQSAIDTAQAQLANASAAYDQAKRNLDAATIKATVAGDVASIATAVGGNVPTTSSPATASANATGFIVLTNVSSLEVTGAFSEADAAKIVAGQIATFSFDALPNVSGTGKVIGVDLLPTTSSGVTTYNATFSIDSVIPGLKPGMTATPTVDVGLAPGVINVSAQAVTTRGARSIVNLVTIVKGKQILTPVRVVVGLKGDSTDEIRSGVKAGDVLALPTVKGSTGSNGFAVGGVPGTLGGGIGGSAATGGTTKGSGRNG